MSVFFSLCAGISSCFKLFAQGVKSGENEQTRRYWESKTDEEVALYFNPQFEAALKEITEKQ